MDKLRIKESQTVAEFIETLKTFPQDVPIRINHMKGVVIYLEEEYYDGDYANPKCPIIKVLVIE